MTNFVEYGVYGSAAGNGLRYKSSHLGWHPIVYVVYVGCFV